MHAPVIDVNPTNVDDIDFSVRNKPANVDDFDFSVSDRIPYVDDIDFSVNSKPVYDCTSCYKVFTRLYRLKNHKCKGKQHSLECEKCHKRYASTSSLSHHKRCCKAAEKLQQIAMLQEEIDNLKQQISITNINNTAHINSHNTNNTNNGVIVNINGLGKENLNYLTQSPGFKKFMTKCIKSKLDGIIDYLEHKHFHPEHPENHNLKKLTKKDDFMQCYDGKKWKLRYCSDIMSDVFDNMQLAFAEFVETTMEDGKLKKVWVDNFMHAVGTPLEWDVDCDDYELETSKMTDEQKKRIKDKVFTLAIEHIYQSSKKRDCL